MAGNTEEVSSHKIHLINGIEVSFPFTPYECQLLYMEKVIQTLQRSTNAILESPTGTGKTLSLLCATLAWREHTIATTNGTTIRHTDSSNQVSSIWDQRGERDTSTSNSGSCLPKIIYASRTHSQLSQAIQELKTTSYKPRVSIVGSRDQLCIHSEVMRKETNAEKVHTCRAKVNSKSCHFYNNLDVKKIALPPNNVMDIEELIALGHSSRMCPYYLARELKTEADLIFMPYNYILDVKTRQTHGIDITNTVVILDEAHNIESVCEESASFELTSTDISHCIEDVDCLLKIEYEEAKDSLTELDSQTRDTLRDLMNLKELFLTLEATLDSITLNSSNECTKVGSYIFEFLDRAGVTMETYGTLLEQLGQAIGSLTTNQSLYRNGNYLQKFVDAIKIVFSTSSCPVGQLKEISSLHYKVYIKGEERSLGSTSTSKDVWTAPAAATAKGKTSRKICYWCFNPGHTMCELERQGVKSVILTSGTLSPLASFSSELQLDFPITLQGSHVIERDQVWVGVVSKGCDGVTLNSSYKNRFQTSYMDSLGNTLINFCRITPGGILVFFPSYVVMETLTKHWRDNTQIFERIEKYKSVYREPRYKSEFNAVMNAFYEKLNQSSEGAIFFAVCRGKVSEGLDFADSNGRAVIITGLPYPPKGEPRVQLKLEYLRNARSKNPQSVVISDCDWYNQQATRAVNQAVGRVIRHKNDYGAIILCDERFNYTKSIEELPQWLRPQVKKYDKFGQAQRDLNVFFKEAYVKYSHLASTKKTKYEKREEEKSSEKTKLLEAKFFGVGGSMGRIKRSADTLLDDVEEVGVVNEYPTASLARISASCHGNRKSGLLSSLQFSESNPVQSHSVASIFSKERRGRQESASVIKVHPYIDLINDNSDVITPVQKKRKLIINNRKDAPVDKVVKAQDFVLQLKDHLSKESMNKFKSATVQYKETENLDDFLEMIVSLFKSPLTFGLLKGVSHFIRPHHIHSYYETYQQITGRPHPSKPHPSDPDNNKDDNS